VNGRDGDTGRSRDSPAEGETEEREREPAGEVSRGARVIYRCSVYRTWVCSSRTPRAPLCTPSDLNPGISPVPLALRARRVMPASRAPGDSFSSPPERKGRVLPLSLSLSLSLSFSLLPFLSPFYSRLSFRRSPSFSLSRYPPSPRKSLSFSLPHPRDIAIKQMPARETRTPVSPLRDPLRMTKRAFCNNEISSLHYYRTLLTRLRNSQLASA